MTGFTRFISGAVLGLLIATCAVADTLEMKDGRIFEGRYLGGTQAVIRFEVNGDVQTFNTVDAVAVTFTGTSGANAATPPRQMSSAPDAPPASASAPAPAPAPSYGPPPAAASAPPQQSSVAVAPDGSVTIPAGQSLLVRMIDGVDSSTNHVGDIFHASLETDLILNNILIARKGADVYGRLAQAQQAGHISGSSELQLELTRMVIDGHDYPLVSSDYSLKGDSRGSDTAKKVGVGAIGGAILGAIIGGGKGAAVGAGVGSAAGAGVQVMTRGQQVKVPSETLLEFRLQQPETVMPTHS